MSKIQTKHYEDDSVTYAKIQNVVDDERILGRVSGADGVIEELTATEVRTMINVEDGAEVNVATNLSEGTATETTVDVNSSDGTNATLVSASTSRAGLLTKVKFDEIVANTLKETNATHTGDVTGSTNLVIDKTAITGKTGVTAVGTDYVLISDTSDTGNLKKALVSDFGGSGDVTKVDTPVAEQIGIWTGDGTIKGDTTFTYDDTDKLLNTGKAFATGKYALLKGAYAFTDKTSPAPITGEERVIFEDETGASSDWGFRVAGGGYGTISYGGSRGTLDTPTDSNTADTLGGLIFSGYDTDDYVKKSQFLGLNDGTFKLLKGTTDGTPGAILDVGSIETTNKTFAFPNKSGTFAMTDDIGSIDGVYSVSTFAELATALEDTTYEIKHIFLTDDLTITENTTITQFGTNHIHGFVTITGNYTVTFDGTDTTSYLFFMDTVRITSSMTFATSEVVMIFFNLLDIDGTITLSGAGMAVGYQSLGITSGSITGAEQVNWFADINMDDIEDGTTYVKTENNLTDAQVTILSNTSNTNSGDNAVNTLYSGLDAAKQKVVAKGTSSTARTTAAKTVTIADYTLAAGDLLAITFTDGFSVNNATLNVNGGGAVNIRVGGVNVTTALVSVAAATSFTMELYYDGTYFYTNNQLNTNTTYTEITEAEIDAGTASTLRTMTGRRAKYMLDKKQDTLISGTNLKTINGETLLGSTDIVVSGAVDGIYSVSTFAELKTALEDTSQEKKYIYVLDTLTITSNTSIALYGNNYVYGNVLFVGAYTLTFTNESDESIEFMNNFVIVNNMTFTNTSFSTIILANKINFDSTITLNNVEVYYESKSGTGPFSGGTVAQLNWLVDPAVSLSSLGVTATAAEINYLEDATSNIQDQIDAIVYSSVSGTFTDGDLSTGVLTVAHTYGNVTMTYVITDNDGKAIIPDEVTYSNNSIAIDLTSYGTLTGTWSYAFGGSGAGSTTVSDNQTITYESGWSGAAAKCRKSGNLCILSGNFTKTSSMSDNELMMTTPAGYRPLDGTWYAGATSNQQDKQARVDINVDGEVTVRDPSDSMTNIVFQISFFIAT